jgi:hypothetical protein
MGRRAAAAFCALALTACAHAPAPAVLVAVPTGGATTPVLAPPEPAERTVTAGACVVDGNGEHLGHDPFVVYEAVDGGRRPVVLVAAPASVHVRWSALPPPGAGDARSARADLAGQGLRLEGWAELKGRTFQIQARARVLGKRVWIRGGSDVELVGEDARGVWVRARTELATPETVDGVLACADVLYVGDDVPEVATDRPEDSGPFVESSVPKLALLDEPAAWAARLEIEPGDLILSAVEHRSGYVRVTGSTGRVSFDAWVQEGTVHPVRILHGHGADAGWGTSVGHGWSSRWRRGTVRADTPLLLGHAGESPRKTTAVVEKGTRVVITRVGGGATADFFFDHRKLVPPEDATFHLDETAVDYD